MDCSPPGSSIHGISQARILEWVVISFSRGSSWPKDRAQDSCIAGVFFTVEPPGKPLSLATHDQNQFLIGQLHPNASGTPQHAYLLNHNSSTLVQMLKNLPAMRETPVQSLIWEDPLETGMAPPTAVFLPGEFHGQRSLVQFMVSQRVRHDWTRVIEHTHTHTHTNLEIHSEHFLLLLLIFQ